MIVTADHGEELGEHGLFEHGESLYRPEIRAPLACRFAVPQPDGGGGAGGRPVLRFAGDDRRSG